MVLDTNAGVRMLEGRHIFYIYCTALIFLAFLIYPGQKIDLKMGLVKLSLSDDLDNHLGMRHMSMDAKAFLAYLTQIFFLRVTIAELYADSKYL
jgi:hypothetical protein